MSNRKLYEIIFYNEKNEEIKDCECDKPEWEEWKKKNKEKYNGLSIQ